MEGELSNWFDKKAKILLELAKGEGKRVIDIGCGTGAITKKFSDAGFDAVGIDTSKKCIDIAKKIKGPSFSNTNISDLKNMLKKGKRAFKQRFDIAVISEVLEHSNNPINDLKNINSVLRPNGVVLVTVPAYQALFSEYDKKAGHVKRYSFQQIKQELNTAGFRVEKMFYWNCLGLLGWALFCKVLGRAPGDAVNPFFNEIYGMFLKIEDHIKFPFGLTIIIKARKQR